MTLLEAIEFAKLYGLKLPRYANATGACAAIQCWIDRVEWLASVCAEGDDDDGTFAEGVEECNRYAGSN